MYDGNRTAGGHGRFEGATEWIGGTSDIVLNCHTNYTLAKG
jgi:hypothetical protein